VRLLVVEDEVELADPLGDLLAREGHVVDVRYDGESAWQLIAREDYDLLILDWMLPGVSGLDLCRRLRERGRATPVLMLTAKDTIDNKVEGFEAGADDYLVKPFELRELLVRVRALLRRPPQLQTEELETADLVLDLRNRCARRGGRLIELSAKEFQLLEYFMRHPNRVLTHEQIRDRLYDADSEPTANALAAQVKLLRRKIDRDFDRSLIHTVYGQGYRFGPH
jgi:OmpR-family two-component system manganese-sensing response regulator